MAEFFTDISQAAKVLAPTIPPQTATSSVNGNALDVSKIGADRMNALLEVGTVSGTNKTLDVKMQAAKDDGTGSPDAATWADIKDRDGNTVAFTQVTTNTPSNQLLAFNLPTVTGATDKPYKYVRAVATIGGSTPSFALSVSLIALSKYDGSAGFQNVSPTIN